MILFANDRRVWHVRSAMERALLESALFAHLTIDDIRAAMDVADVWVSEYGSTLGLVRSPDDLYGPHIWGWMADKHDVTCAICHRQFMWSSNSRMDLGHFAQRAIPRHKPMALKITHPDRRQVLTPFCQDCALVLFKANCSRYMCTDDFFALGLSELLRSKSVKERVKEWAGQKLRIHPASKPDGADASGNLFICDDGSLCPARHP